MTIVAKETLIDMLAKQWIDAKQAESNAIAARRTVEDRMKEIVGIPETLDGTETVDGGLYMLKIVGRIDRKVDGDKLQEIAAEYGLTEHLGSLFRWKPEINMAAWKSASDAITKPFAVAVTAKPGRPSFSITTKE
jgi:hypothetical protein